MRPCAEERSKTSKHCPGAGGTTWFPRAGHALDVVHTLLLPSMKPDKGKYAIGRGDTVDMRIIRFTPHAQRERRCQRTSRFYTIALLLGEWQNQDLKLFVVTVVVPLFPSLI